MKQENENLNNKHRPTSETQGAFPISNGTRKIFEEAKKVSLTADEKFSVRTGLVEHMKKNPRESARKESSWLNSLLFVGVPVAVVLIAVVTYYKTPTNLHTPVLQKGIEIQMVEEAAETRVMEAANPGRGFAPIPPADEFFEIQPEAISAPQKLMLEDSSSAGVPTPAAGIMPMDRVLKTVDTVDRGNFAAEYTTYVIDGQKTWENFWKNLHPERSYIPEIDFDKYYVVGVFTKEGSKVSRKEIVNVFEDGPDLKVVVEIAKCQKETGLTPYHIVTLPKTDKGISFDFREIPCE